MHIIFFSFLWKPFKSVDNLVSRTGWLLIMIKERSVENRLKPIKSTAYRVYHIMATVFRCMLRQGKQSSPVAFNLCSAFAGTLRFREYIFFVIKLVTIISITSKQCIPLFYNGNKTNTCRQTQLNIYMFQICYTYRFRLVIKPSSAVFTNSSKISQL
jgi:hypothetical protein